MKKQRLIALLLLAALLLAGCGDTADQTAVHADTEVQVIDIKEKMFIAQTNDVYVNPKEYIGKTLRLQGMFGAEMNADGTPYYMVFRYGPGCCGYDANAGFEVAWDGKYPSVNDWVEATGVLETYIEDNQVYMRLRLSALNVLDTRGLEYVNQ